MQECGNIETSLSYFKRMTIPSGVRILDVGTRFSTLVHQLDRLGYHDSFGIDVDNEAVSKGKSSYPELKNRLRSYEGKIIPFDTASFDVVTMFDVLEHIPNVGGFLRSEVGRILKPGGLFVFQTPNILTNVPWEIFAHKSFSAWKKYHCSLQTYGSLRRLLLGAGFTSIKIERYLVLSPFNRNLIRQKFKLLAPMIFFLLKCSSLVPKPFVTNFWGFCHKS
jgi:SAM-dependent methyltransferase